MAAEWQDMHTFAADDIHLAQYIEALRANYFHIREPRFAVAYGKGGTLTMTGGVGVRAWSAIDSQYIDPITIETSGRDLLIAANPVSQLSSSAAGAGGVHVWGIQYDGADYYSNTNGLSLHNSEDAIDVTVPIFTVIPAPTAGQHTVTLFASASHSVGGSSSSMKFPGNVFLLAMEI